MDAVFESPRALVRTWTPADLPLALALWGDPAVTAHLARVPLSVGDVRARLSAEIASQREHGVQYGPAFLRDAGGAFLGCCGLRPRPALPSGERVLELGVHLLPARQGRGLAAELARAAAAHAFETLDVPVLFAGHHPDNEASHRLLARLGFRYTHDEFHPPTGRRHPSYLLRRGELAAQGAGQSSPPT